MSRYILSLFLFLVVSAKGYGEDITLELTTSTPVGSNSYILPSSKTRSLDNLNPRFVLPSVLQSTLNGNGGAVGYIDLDFRLSIGLESVYQPVSFQYELSNSPRFSASTLSLAAPKAFDTSIGTFTMIHGLATMILSGQAAGTTSTTAMDVILNYSPVPEPSRVGLLFVCVGVLANRRRPRR